MAIGFDKIRFFRIRKVTVTSNAEQYISREELERIEKEIKRSWAQIISEEEYNDILFPAPYVPGAIDVKAKDIPPKQLPPPSEKENS